MKNSFIKIISFVIVFCTVLGLCACSKKQGTQGIATTNRQVTRSSAESKTQTTVGKTSAATAPQGKAAILKYFNDSVKIFNNRTYDFTKSFNCTLQSCSLGSLTSVSGATDSYKSTLRSAVGDMMGVSKLDTSYYAGDDISSVFTIKELDEKCIESIKASADGNKVTVEISLKQLSADGTASVSYLTKDYPTPESFSQKISDYKISATSTSVKSSSAKVKVVVDNSTKNFVSVEISFKTNYSAQELNLGYITGGPVSGVTQTVITYKNFKEI